MTEIEQVDDPQMLERLRNPDVNLICRPGELQIDSPETRFFDEWERLREAIITEPEVRAFSQAFYARFAFHLDWFPPLGTEEFRLCWSRPHPHFCDGLQALSYLFAVETFDSIKFQPVEKFPQCKGYPFKTFKLGETGCRFRDWQQGYVLAQVRFGEITANHRAVKQTLAEFSSDSDFIERFTKEVRRGPRQMLSILHQFAKAWDIFLLPLRYFTCEAALDFVAEQYSYPGRDIKRFRVVFLKGGNENQRRGLKLSSARPSIVWKWNKNLIRLNGLAAAHHGYNPELLQKMLGERYERRVSL